MHDSAIAHLRAQHLEEMRALIEDYTIQKAEIARERDEAREEAAGIAQERDAYQEAYNTELHRVAETRLALEQTTTELIKKRDKLKAARKALVDEEARYQKRKNLLKNALAVNTATLENRLHQAEERERSERADKEEMKRLNEDLIERSHRIQQEMADLKKTHKQWRLKYSDALTEKIDLLRQYGPAPILPIEVIANIAGFVAGANDYAGLAAMSLTSHTMEAELKPILYETVIWNPIFHDRLHRPEEQDLADAGFRHIRFIILQGSQFACVDSYKERSLPNLRAVIQKDGSTTNTTLANGGRKFPQHSVRLYIMRNTNLPTISSILRHPLRWSYAGEENWRSSVRSISYIEIAADATLTLGDSESPSLFKPLASPALTVNLRMATGGTQSRRIEASVGAIRQMMLSAGSKSTLPEVEFCIEDASQESLDAWITQLRQWLNLKPLLRVLVQIPCDQLDIDRFRDITHQFRAMYESLWQEDARFFHQGNREDPSFLCIYTSPSNPNLAFLTANLARLRSSIGFRIKIRHYHPLDHGDGEVDTIFAQRYALDGTTDSFIALDGNVDTSDSGSSTDDSSDTNDDSDGDSSDDSNSDDSTSYAGSAEV